MLLSNVAIKKENGLSLIHISEPTRRSPTSYAVFCLQKYRDHRDLHLSIRRQRQMCIRDSLRISGPLTQTTLDAFVERSHKKGEWQARILYHGHFHDPDGEFIDEIMAVYF